MSRFDGRPLTALRPISFETGINMHHKGAVLVSFGNTKVMVTATYENRVPPFRLNSGGGWLTAEYSMLPGSTSSRKRRDKGGKVDGRGVEIQRLIGRSLRQSVNMKAMGQFTIHVDCDVIQADGGTRTAAITGGWVAIALCLQAMIDDKRAPTPFKKVEKVLKEQVAAVSMGIIKGEVYTDLCYVEDVEADTDFNMVGTAAGGVIELQGTAEGAVMKRAEIDKVLDQGEAAIQELARLQREAVEAAR